MNLCEDNTISKPVQINNQNFINVTTNFNQKYVCVWVVNWFDHVSKPLRTKPSLRLQIQLKTSHSIGNCWGLSAFSKRMMAGYEKLHFWWSMSCFLLHKNTPQSFYAILTGKRIHKSFMIIQYPTNYIFSSNSVSLEKCWILLCMLPIDMSVQFIPADEFPTALSASIILFFVMNPSCVLLKWMLYLELLFTQWTLQQFRKLFMW